SLPGAPQFSHRLDSGRVLLVRERVRLATARRASRRSPHHPTKLIVLPTSRLDKGTQGDRRHCLCEVLSLTKGLGTGRHHHAAKAILAGLRSRSTRSAGFRHGYDCTARIAYVTSLERKIGTKRT